MRRTAICAAVQLILCLPTLACEGQTGKVIFEDNFADDSGGWDIEGAKIAAIKPPELVVTPTATRPDSPVLNLTFQALAGDYCMEFALPASPAPDNQAAAGITFWARDYLRRDIFIAYSTGFVSLLDERDGRFYHVYREKVPEFKADPGAINTLRVIAKRGTLTLMLNGTVLKTVRAQFPDTPLRFGVDAGIAKGRDQAPTIRVKSFKVTAVE